MAVTATPIFPQTIQNFGIQILPADTTTKKTVLTGGTDGTKIEWIALTSTDTAAKDVQFWLSDGTTDYLLTTMSCTANAGFTNNVVPVAVFASTQSPFFSFDSNGNKYLYLKAGWSLKAAVLSSVTAAKIVYVIGQAANF